jgi:hypothetical protein
LTPALPLLVLGVYPPPRLACPPHAALAAEPF